MLRASAVGCNRCPLSAKRHAIVDGRGPANAPLMVVGDGPSREDDRAAAPFLSQSGQLLRAEVIEACKRAGVDSTAVYWTLATRCKPRWGQDIEKSHLEACLPWLVGEIDEVQPKVILAVGKLAQEQVAKAIAALCPWCAGDGCAFCAEQHAELVVEAYSPGYIVNQRGKLEAWRGDIRRAVEAAFGITPVANEVLTADVPWSIGEPDLTARYIGVDTEFDTLDDDDLDAPTAGWSISDGRTANFYTMQDVDGLALLERLRSGRQQSSEWDTSCTPSSLPGNARSNSEGDGRDASLPQQGVCRADSSEVRDSQREHADVGPHDLRGTTKPYQRTGGDGDSSSEQWRDTDGDCDGTRAESANNQQRRSTQIYLHNAKADLLRLGLDPDDLDSWQDTILMAYVLRKWDRLGLKKLGPALTGIEWQTELSDMLKELVDVPWKDEVKVEYSEKKGKWVTAVEKNGWRRSKSSATQLEAQTWIAPLIAKVDELEPKPLQKKWQKCVFSRALQTRWEEASTYAATDAVVTARLARALEQEFQLAPWAREYYETIEKPLVPVLLSMEQSGVRIDPDALRSAATVIDEARARTETSLRETFGPDINLASNDQMGPVLASMGLLDGKRTDSGGLGCAEANILGAFSVDEVEDIPDTTEGKLARTYLEWKYMGGLKSKYVDGIVGRPASPGKKEKPNRLDADSRIHPRLNQTSTSVNRLSSSNPNEQNIPSRPKRGFSHEVVYIGASIRRAFVPKPGCVFAGGDFSQLQPRIWRELTDDPVFVAAYAEGGFDDIYIPTATELDFRLPEGKIDRQRAKPVVLGAMYGGGDETLGKAAGVAPEKMGEFLKRLHTRMPSIEDWPKQISQILAAQGYVESLLGWRMYFPDAFSPVNRWAAKALREASNAPIISTEAGLVKVFMTRVRQMLRKHYPAWQLVLVVHDELFAEGPEAEGKEVAQMMSELAVEVGKEWLHKVTLRFDPKVVTNWADAK